MSILEIGIAYDDASFKFTIDLEGTIYLFRFNWNTRNERWFFDIMLEDETPLLYGLPVFVNWDVVGRFKNALLPKGKIGFYDTSGQLLDPGRQDLGDRVRMLYAEAT